MLKAEEDKILKQVAKKTNSSKYNHEEFLENIEAKRKEYLERKEKERIALENMHSEISFKPQINGKSKKITNKKKGPKTFRERQVEYEKNKRSRIQELKNNLEPSFRPKLNPKSKKVRNKVKSQSNLGSASKPRPPTDNPNQSTASKQYNEPIYNFNNITEVDENQETTQNKTIDNQIQYVNNDEIREISEFINANRGPYFENIGSADAFMEMIFSQNNISQQNKDKDNYDQSEDEVGINDRVEEVQNNSNNDTNNDINEREVTDLAFSHDSDEEQEDQILSLNDHQHGHSHKQDLVNIEQHRIDTNDRLETVGEATIEDTTKQDVTEEENKHTSVPETYVMSDEKRMELLYNSQKPKTEEDPLKKLMRMENKPKITKPFITPEELGLGSMELLDAILKQYNHIVK